MVGFQTVWSVDVGKSSLKAVKLQRERNSLEILAVDKIDYPVDEGGVNSLQHAKEALETFASRNTINCPIVASHPGHSAFSRFIQLPPVDPKKLEEMVGYEAQQQIPFPIDEVVWDYHLCEQDGAPEAEVGIFAVRKEVVSDFMLDYESAGMPLDMISVGYLGLLNYVVYDLRPQRPSVVIDIGSDHTDLVVVDGKRFWIRNLPIAGNDITQALMDKFKLPFDEAERLKTTAAKTEHAVKVFTAIQPILKELVNEIHRSVGFYKSQAGDVKFEDVFLFGNSAKVLGIQKFLQEQLRFRVHVAKKLSRIRVNRESNVSLLQRDFPSFASAVGNAIQGLGEGEADVNLMPREQQEALEFQRKQKQVIFACLGLFIVPIVWFVLFGGKVEEANRAIEEAKQADPWIKNDRAIKSARADQAKVAADWEALRLAAAHRVYAQKTLATLTAVCADLDGGKVVPTQQLEPDEFRKTEVEDAQSTLNDGKLWLTSYDVDMVARDAKGGDVTLKGRKAGLANAVIGYRVTLRGVITKRDNQQQNQDFIRAQLVKPLEAAIAAEFGAKAAFSEPSWVTGVPPGEAVETIYAQPEDFRDRTRIKGSQKTQDSVFQPFQYSFTLQDPSSIPTQDKPTDEDEE
ncbi:MAG: type IV pilus assembly protein PilM [Planctomycetota bacterium]